MPSILLFPLSEILENETPLGTLAQPSPELAALLAPLSYYEFARIYDGRQRGVSFVIVIDSEIGYGAPGIPSLRLVVAAGGNGITVLKSKIFAGRLQLEGVTVALRFPTEWLRPVRPNTRDLAEGQAELSISSNVEISWEHGLDINFDSTTGVSLSRSMIADTGIIVSASEVDVKLSGGDRGIFFDEAKLELPPDIAGLPDLTLRDCAITANGFSGSISAEWAAATITTNNITQIDETNTEVVASLFSPDFKLAARSLAVRIENNRLTECGIRGWLQFPQSVLETVVEAEVSVTDSGEFLVGLRGMGDDGLITLTKKDLFSFRVNGFTFKHTREETSFSIDGDLTIDKLQSIGTVALQGFTIFKAGSDSWRFRLEGGAIQINKSFELFDVARADILEIGFGERDGWNTFSFSGGVQLLEGVQGGASVKGLRIPWRTQPSFEVGGITADGVGLELVVPNSFAFIGAIERHEEAGKSYLQGEVGVYLFPVELEIGVAMKVGKTDECRFAFLSAYVIWPGPGVALVAGLFLRGLKGLIGGNVAPDANGILEYYPLSSKEPLGLESPTKWRDSCGSFALGVGAFVATASPKLFSMEALFAFLYPQMQLLIQGSAFVLESPAPGKRPPFEALLALDIVERAALINVGAKAEFLKGLFQVDGMLEVYYGPDPQNPGKTTGYFALGQVRPYFPVDRPVRGKLLKVFPADSYFIVMRNTWALGGGIGLPKKKYSFAFASVHFEAQMRVDGRLDFSPVQFQGRGRLAGAVGFRVFGKGFDLSLGADVFGQAPDWLIDARLWFGIKIRLIVKTKHIGGQIPFHWEKPQVPPVPKLLKEIALKHGLTQLASVPFLAEGGGSLETPVPDLSLVPDVEPNTFATVEFAFPTRDTTGLPFGQNIVTVPTIRSGDHEFEAKLEGAGGALGIEMYRRPLCAPGEQCNVPWQQFRTDVEALDAEAAGSTTPFLFGAWQAAEAPGGLGFSTHLHLFSRTPFDFTRPSRTSWANSSVMWDVQEIGVATAITARNTAPVANTDTVQAESIGASNGNGLPLASSKLALIEVPILKDGLKSRDRLRSLGKPLPSWAVQYGANEDPFYPHTGARFLNDGTLVPAETEIIRRCRNFLGTRVGYRKPMEVISFDEQRLVADDGPDGDVLIGGHGTAIINGQPVRLGNCHIVQQHGSPYPLRWFEWHCNRGLDPDTGLLRLNQPLRDGVLKIAFRNRVRQLIIHYAVPQSIAAQTPRGVGCGGSNSLFGIVIDCAGDPITRANVTIEKSTVSATTDSECRFCIESCLWEGEQVTVKVTENDGSSWRQKVKAEGRPVGLFRPNPLFPPGSSPVVLSAAFKKAFSRRNFWQDGERVNVPPVVDYQQDKVVLTAGSKETFNEVVFRVGARVQIYSLCYEIDRTAELVAADNHLQDFIDVTWPNDGGSQWSPGPGFIANFGYTVDGSLIPGYLYKLVVRTSHQRLRKNPQSPTYKEYTAYFKVSRPPSDLSPYVALGFPRDDGFPHFRGDPIYLRMNRNYVHKLFTAHEDNVVCQFRQEGSEFGQPLPFRDGQDADGNQFDQDISADRRGWGWGKCADGHLITLEEAAWIESYNRSVPTERHISESNAIPDDFLWAYPSSPFLIRAEFSENVAPDGSIGPFAAATGESGQAAPGLWAVDAATLRHSPSAAGTPTAHSYLLSTMSLVPGSYRLSVWVKPNGLKGRFEIVAAAGSDAGKFLAQSIAVQFDLAASRITLLQKIRSQQKPTQKAEKPLALPVGKWTRLEIRIAPRDVKVAVTVMHREEILLAGEVDIGTPSGQVGLGASADFNGAFDNFEVLSLNRLSELPRSSARHQLILKYIGGEPSVVYEHEFTTSQFVDMLDLMNSWDRRIWLASNAASDPTAAAAQWTQAEIAVKTELGNLRAMETRYARNEATVQELEANRAGLRDARFALDNAFSALALTLGFEPSAVPDRLQFLLAQNRRAVLVEFTEPVDWTRYATGEISSATVSIEPAVYYTSDCTRLIALLPLTGGLNQFAAGSSYLWRIRQYAAIPEHLAWLRGWLDYRKRDFILTLEVPAV